VDSTPAVERVWANWARQRGFDPEDVVRRAHGRPSLTTIRELKRRYDWVFFDSPPIMGVSDASILSSEVDMVLQVIQYRRYPQPMTIRAKQMIEKVGGNLLGIVLNNISMASDENYYYYSGYYYDYYSKQNDDDESGDKPSAKSRKDEAKLKIEQKY